MDSVFDYEGARRAGYSDEEIEEYLKSPTRKKKSSNLENVDQNAGFFENIRRNASNFTKSLFSPSDQQEDESPKINQRLLQQNPKFDFEGALNAGYTIDEIENHLESKKPERSFLDKAARIGTQAALGLAGGTPNGIVYDLSVAPLASKEAQLIPYREMLSDELEQLMEKKAWGQWDDQDQALYENIVEQIKDPEKAIQHVKTVDVTLKGLAEKATGSDLTPEGIAEKAANWIGFIKDPKKLAKLGTNGISTKEVMKAIAPSSTETLRGLGAATALQMAEEGDFGPIGTIASAVIGDLAGGGLKSIYNAGKTAITDIKGTKDRLAKSVAKLVPKEKQEIQKQLIKDFREAGIQADIGTITDNHAIKWVQAKLAQSGLTGEPLQNLKNQMIADVKDQYKKIADELGSFRFQTLHEAGEVGKQYITSIRDLDKARIGKMYDKARQRISSSSEEARIKPNNLALKIIDIEEALKPGSLKSTEQNAVLDALEKLKKDLYVREKGNLKLKYASIEDLMNNKIALSDIINYEVQGGQKQLLKSIVKEIDNEILAYGRQDPEFLKLYSQANKSFSQHAHEFRNSNINRIITSEDPMHLINKMNSVQGIRDIEKVLKKSAQGTRLFNDLKRLKLDQMVGNKMVDNVSSQLKTGTFANLLKNPKDKQIIKEILGKEAFERLTKLQKRVGQLEETARKFFNTSQSASSIVDIGFVSKTLGDMAAAFAGNPWPIFKTSIGYKGAGYLSTLMADPKFLKSVEEAILASKNNNTIKMIRIGEEMNQMIIAAMAKSGMLDQSE